MCNIWLPNTASVSNWKQCVHHVALHLHPLIQIKAKQTAAEGKEGYFSISVENVEIRDNTFEKKKDIFLFFGVTEESVHF